VHTAGVPSSPRPHPLGVTRRGSGIDVAVFAARAESLEVCVLCPRDGGWEERRVALPERTHGVWHGHVPDVPAGTRYGLRARGPWDPARGHRYNPDKLLLDPYARAVAGRVELRPEVYGHTVNDELRGDTGVRDPRDSAPFVPHGVVVEDDGADGSAETREPFSWRDDAPPDVPWSQTVVYEAHVKGLTRLQGKVPEHLRGTYAALAHPATVEHLVGLGVTTVELLPVHAMASEAHLARRGRTNYWGYNTLGFFAPNPSYAAARTPGGVVREVRAMVRDLHAAGLEVVLDVVYNHTCEAGVDGPTLSLRGLDAAAYYRLDAHGRDLDVTGCGNSLDFRHPRVVQLALDSLRHWVGAYHVDGFRFDLATTLARGRDGFDPDHPFLVAVRADPVLAGVKLIAEPWDVGPHGWRTGQFPPPFAEWNDRFRDSVRTFWLADGARVSAGGTGHGVRELATRLAGSADFFGSGDRGPLAAVNYVASHDGFTLADCTAYEHKHNEANGEDNRDGHGDNRTWNAGVEGATDDEDVLRLRRRSLRNLLGTVLLATGVPMLGAGDEMGRTQRGNNNAYCQDNELSWVHWDLDAAAADVLATTTFLLRLRREQPALRQRRFFAGRPVHADGTKDLAWFAPDGSEMTHDRWHDAAQRTLVMYLHGGRVDAESLVLVAHGGPERLRAVLPGPPWSTSYRLLWDSSWERPPQQGERGPRRTRGGAPVTVEPFSLQLHQAHRPASRRR
jgi:isoamylase